MPDRLTSGKRLNRATFRAYILDIEPPENNDHLF